MKHCSPLKFKLPADRLMKIIYSKDSKNNVFSLCFETLEVYQKIRQTLVARLFFKQL